MLASQKADVNSRVTCSSEVESPLREGTVPTCEHEGLTPLFLAYLNRHWSTVQLLLVLGADANVQNTHGDTVLHLALKDKGLKGDRQQEGKLLAWENK